MNVEDTLIEDIKIGPRTHNFLLNGNIKTLGELVKMSESELLRVPNVGRKSLNQVVKMLKEYGLELRRREEQ